MKRQFGDILDSSGVAAARAIECTHVNKIKHVRGDRKKRPLGLRLLEAIERTKHIKLSNALIASFASIVLCAQ